MFPSGNELTLGCPISFSLFVLSPLIAWLREFIALVTSAVTAPARKLHIYCWNKRSKSKQNGKHILFGN